MFGLCFDFLRRARGQTFRKRLGMDYKLGKRHTHKSPHIIPLNQKQQLLNSRPGGNWKAIHELVRESTRPFGKYVGKSIINAIQSSCSIRARCRRWTSPT